MKIIKYILIIAIGTLVSCNDFLDVNTNPSAANQDQISPQLLLPTAITGTANAQFSAAYTSSLVTHHLDNVQAGYYQNFTMGGAWSNAYLVALNSLQTIVKNANEKSPHYVGIAKILQAFNLGLLTDCWENIPYEEALQGETNITPKFNSQEDIYAKIQSLLDESIEKLSETNSFYKPGKDDLIYGGNISKWVKLAHSLKARYMLHLSNKSNIDWNVILTEAAQGFESNEDDFQLPFPSNKNKANPWYDNVSKKIDQNIFTKTPARYFIDVLNGNIFNVVDPRLQLIAELIDAEATKYIGLASYEDVINYTCISNSNSWYMGIESPLLMMTFAELKFIEAEAALNTNPSTAYDAYLAGIEANMSKLGVNDSLKTVYLDNESVKLDGNTDLQHVMKEKYIALYLNPESWTDMRRYNFKSEVFKGFVEPDYNNRNKPIQRAMYPLSERDRNQDNTTQNRKDVLEQMWRDLK